MTLLVFSLAIGAPAICHFAYTAYRIANCYVETGDGFGNRELLEIYPGCMGVPGNSEDQMRLDTLAVLAGALLFMGSVGISYRLKKYRRRIRAV
jgi:hypothetical protein